MKKDGVREAALKVLYRVEVDKAYLRPLFKKIEHEQKLNARDRAFLEQLVKGTLEKRGQIDSCLNNYLKRGISSLTPWVRNILRLGAYQLAFLDRIPAQAAVNESVKLAKRYGHRGTSGLVNAVLRKIAREKPFNKSLSLSGVGIKELAKKLNHPEWLFKRFVEQLGKDEAVALCVANNESVATNIRINTERTSRSALKTKLSCHGIECAEAEYSKYCLKVLSNPRRISFSDIAEFKEGLFYIQDESSALIAELLNVESGDTVLDVCAAPGGKALSLSLKMKDSGLIVAADLAAHRQKLVKDNYLRLGLKSIVPLVADARALPFLSAFKKIILDVPCSGSGVLGRKKDLRWNRKEEDLKDLTHLQTTLLEQAATLLVPGAVLLYSTCSIDREENEAIVESFLNKNPDFTRASIKGHCDDNLISPEGYFRSYPHRHQIGGAFAALIQKNT